MAILCFTDEVVSVYKLELIVTATSSWKTIGVGWFVANEELIYLAFANSYLLLYLVCDTRQFDSTFWNQKRLNKFSLKL